MDELVIQTEQLMSRLYEIARQENRSLEDILESLLADYDPNPCNDDPSPRSFAANTESIPGVEIRLSHHVDIGGNAQEILEKGYQDYLKRRTK